MKRRGIIVLVVSVAVLVVAFLLYVVLKPCEHQWDLANCEEPKRCAICEETEGEPLGHQWGEATCESPAMCQVCYMEKGEKREHQWKEATCTAAKTCTLCEKEEGEPIEHQWVDATESQPKTCSGCGLTEGKPLERQKVRCIVCHGSGGCMHCNGTGRTATPSMTIPGRFEMCPHCNAGRCRNCFGAGYTQ